MAFTVADPVVPANQLVLGVNSSNVRLVPISNIQISGSGTNRTLTITPRNQ